MNEKEFDYINVIPLVDVMLVLLTIVLTTSSFIAIGVIPMELPKATRSYGEVVKTQTIEIDSHSTVYLNGAMVSLGALKSTLETMNRSIPILIRADRAVALQRFVEVFDILKGLGFSRISLHTQIQR